jgi:hypothetical protein
MRSSFERYWKGFERCSKGLVVALALAAPAVAQPFDLDPVPERPPGFVLVDQIGPDAVIMQGERVLTPRPTDAGWLLGPLESGRASLTIWPDGVGAWDGRAARAEVLVLPADTVRIRPDVPARTVLTSVPYGARVTLEREGSEPVFVGTTPLRLDTEAPLVGTLRVEREGYADERVPLGETLTERHAVLLRPAAVEDEPHAVAGVYTYGETRNPGRRWIDYAAAGLAVAGAATAIYYKFEADALDDRLRDPADPSRSDRLLEADLLSRRDRLDTASLVGLGAMQVGVGVLAVRFVLR